MLDKRTEQMLKIANILTAEDLDEIREDTATAVVEEPPADVIVEERPAESGIEESPPPSSGSPPEPPPTANAGVTRGDRERTRTRESKISTACVGQQRQKHEWWPVAAELVGSIGTEEFTGEVIQNDQVKSGRSVLITSGAAQGKVCLTPTRAAIEATEAYRQAHKLGRGGGVTNGWTFWKSKE